MSADRDSRARGWPLTCTGLGFQHEHLIRRENLGRDALSCNHPRPPHLSYRLTGQREVKTKGERETGQAAAAGDQALIR